MQHSGAWMDLRVDVRRTRLEKNHDHLDLGNGLGVERSRFG